MSHDETRRITIDQLKAGELPPLTPEACERLSALMVNMAYQEVSRLGWSSQVDALLKMSPEVFPDALDRAFEVARDKSQAESALGVDKQQRLLLIKVGDAALERGDGRSVALAVKVVQAYEKPPHPDGEQLKYEQYPEHVAKRVAELADGYGVRDSLQTDSAIHDNKIFFETAVEATALRNSPEDTIIDLYTLYQKWPRQSLRARIQSVVEINEEAIWSSRQRRDSMVVGLSRVVRLESETDETTFRDLACELGIRMDDPECKMTLHTTCAAAGDERALRLAADYAKFSGAYRSDAHLASVVLAGARLIDRSAGPEALTLILRSAYAIPISSARLRAEAFATAAKALDTVRRRFNQSPV